MFLLYMNKILIIILTALCGILPAQAATSASSVLDKAASKINAAKSLTAEYTISSGNSHENGRLVLASGKFTLNSPSLRTWYDGMTMWTYSPALDEVNITTPTAEELLEINPFAVINNYKSLYTPRITASGKGSYTIELKPKRKGQIFSKAILVIDASTYSPKSIQLTMSDGSKVLIDVKSVTAGAFPGNDAFRFKKSDAPKAEIIDLR